MPTLNLVPVPHCASHHQHMQLHGCLSASLPLAPFSRYPLVFLRFVAPTLLRDVPWDAPIMQEECFAPLLAVQTVGGQLMLTEPHR